MGYQGVLRLFRAAALLGGAFASPAMPEAAPLQCPGGRFLLDPGDSPLLGGAPTSQADAVVLRPAESFVSIAGCGEPVRLHLRQRRGGAEIRATWEACGDLRNVRLRARVERSCGSVSGVVKASTLRAKRFRATLSQCGDGVVDPVEGEACDDGNRTDGDGCVSTCGVASPFVDMTFDQYLPPGLPVQVVLHGVHRVSPGGDITGQLTATYGVRGGATVFAGREDAYGVRLDGTTVEVLAADPAFMAVDGVRVPTETMLEKYAADVASGLDPDDWSVEGQAILVLQAVASSDSWGRNAEAAYAASLASPWRGGAVRYQSFLFSHETWCKVVSIGAAALVVGFGSAACLSLEGICDVGAVVTVGGLAIPCIVLLGACEGLTFLGGEVVKELVSHWWETGEVPTTTTTSTSTTTSGVPTTTIASTTTTTSGVPTTTASSTTTSTTMPPCTTVRCITQAALAGPECTGELVPARVTRLLDRGTTLAQRAALSRRARHAKQLRRRAERTLRRAGHIATRLARGARPKLSGACAASIQQAVDVATAGLRGGSG
jgi:cysteine-rich repeat protein